MNISDYFNKLKENVNRVSKSNAKDIVDLTIKNYAIYNSYFVGLQEKLSTDGNEISSKLNALNFLVMHSTFMFNSFINDLICNNYFSAKVNLRIIIEFYFKYLFLLYSDDYVSELYLDFNCIYTYNLSMKFDNYLRMKSKEQEELKNYYNKINEKYNLPHNVKEDYWIKLALEQNTGKKNNKSIQSIIDWLKDNEKIEDAIIISYEDNCDFNHCGIGSLNYQQLIDLYDSQEKLYEIYQPVLSEFNYVIFKIINKFMDEYNTYSNQDVIEVMLNNLNIIFGQGGD